MNKLTIAQKYQDLSGEMLKQALIKSRRKNIIKLVYSQTNYDMKYSEKLLEENNYDYLTIIKGYLQPKNDKKNEKVCKTLNQKIFGEIRHFMDEGYKETQRRKKRDAYIKKVQQMRKRQEEKNKAMEEGNKKIS